MGVMINAMDATKKPREIDYRVDELAKAVQKKIVAWINSQTDWMFNNLAVYPDPPMWKGNKYVGRIKAVVRMSSKMDFTSHRMWQNQIALFERMARNIGVANVRALGTGNNTSDPYASTISLEANYEYSIGKDGK